MSTATINPEVIEALKHIGSHFGPQVVHEADGEGGALVTIDKVDLASSWGRRKAPLRFIIPYTYPAIPPYPFYLPRDVDPPQPWPQALQPIEWRGEQMIQVSLRNNNWDPARDSVAGCVLQVATWLREQ